MITLIFSKKFIEISEFDEILEKISDTNFQGTLMHTSSLIVYKNGLENSTKSLFCKEYLMTVSMVAYLRKSFYLTEIVNEKILIFHAAGLIDFWDRRSKIAIERNVDPVKDHRKPINFTNLKGMFMVYLYACGASILCCIVEVIYSFVTAKSTERIIVHKKTFVRHANINRNK